MPARTHKIDEDMTPLFSENNHDQVGDEIVTESEVNKLKASDWLLKIVDN